MALGAIIAAIGTGLISTIGLETSTVRWATFMVTTGVGIGLGIQLPYTAVQMIAKSVGFNVYIESFTDGVNREPDVPTMNGEYSDGEL